MVWCILDTPMQSEEQLLTECVQKEKERSLCSAPVQLPVWTCVFASMMVALTEAHHRELGQHD